MKDIQAAIERLTKEAAECEMICNLATDPAKQELFKRLAERHRQIVEELKGETAKLKPPESH